MMPVNKIDKQTYLKLISKKRSKLHNELKEYNNEIYHSKREAAYAYELDLELKAGAIIAKERQVRIPLTVNNVLICTMVIDFLVTLPDGSKEFREVKGFETDEFKLKYKLLKATYLVEHPEIGYKIIK